MEAVHARPDLEGAANGVLQACIETPEATPGAVGLLRRDAARGLAALHANPALLEVCACLLVRT